MDALIQDQAISRIEDIVLQDDIRGMTALKPHMPSGYMDACANLLLDHPGKVLIVTGFYIMAAKATETDGHLVPLPSVTRLRNSATTWHT